MQKYNVNNRDLQRMAAMVLFKDLHAKMVDIYDVLAEFIKEIIIENGLIDFTCDEILNLLINQVGFKEIPR